MVLSKHIDYLGASVKNRNLIIMSGIPGAGKSFYIDKYLPSHQVVCRDDIRLSLGTIYEPRLENFVTAITTCIVEAHMIRGLAIVLDETSLNYDRIQQWVNLAVRNEYLPMLYRINTPLDICRRRREGFPGEVMERMYSNHVDLWHKLHDSPIDNLIITDLPGDI